MAALAMPSGTVARTTIAAQTVSSYSGPWYQSQAVPMGPTMRHGAKARIRRSSGHRGCRSPACPGCAMCRQSPLRLPDTSSSASPASHPRRASVYRRHGYVPGPRTIAPDAAPLTKGVCPYPITAINGDRGARRKEPRGEGSIRLTKDLLRPVIREPPAERVDGGRKLQIPAGRAVDAGDSSITRKAVIGSTSSPPNAADATSGKSRSAHRVGDGIGQVAFPFGIGRMLAESGSIWWTASSNDDNDALVGNRRHGLPPSRIRPSFRGHLPAVA